MSWNTSSFLHCLFGFKRYLDWGKMDTENAPEALWKNLANRKVHSVITLLAGKQASVFFIKSLFKQESA